MPLMSVEPISRAKAAVTAVDQGGSAAGPKRRVTSGFPVPLAGLAYPRAVGTPVVRRMTIPGHVVSGIEDQAIDTKGGFLVALRSLDIAALRRIQDHLVRSEDPDAADALQQTERILTEAEGLEAEAGEDYEEYEEDQWVLPSVGKKTKPKSQRGKRAKPVFNVAESKELDAIAREFGGKIGAQKAFTTTFRSGDRDARVQFLKTGGAGNKVGDVVERVGEGKVRERATKEFGDTSRVWSSTRLRIMDDAGKLGYDMDELDFLIIDGSGAMVAVVSAKTSPTAVAPATDRLHLNNYYTFPTDLRSPQAKLQLARASGMNKESLHNKVELYFQYTEDGADHTMKLTDFRTRHPLKVASSATAQVIGLTPFSTARIDTNPILLGLTEEELFDQLIKRILAVLPKPAK